MEKESMLSWCCILPVQVTVCNSLYVAKKLDDVRLSIPQIIFILC